MFTGEVVYIAGPIANDPDYELKFKAAEKYLRSQGLVTLNPAAIVGPFAKRFPKRSSDKNIMRACRRLIDGSDILALLPGWFQSKGATAEVAMYTQAFIMNDKTRSIWIVELELRTKRSKKAKDAGKYEVDASHWYLGLEHWEKRSTRLIITD